MYSLKKEFERHVKLVNEQLLSYQCNQGDAVPSKLQTTSAQGY